MFKKLWLVGLPFLILSGNTFARDFLGSKNKYDALADEYKLQFKQDMVNREWQYSSETDAKKAYINYNYIKPLNTGEVEAWLKMVIYKDIKKDGLAVGDYTMILSLYDCTAQKYKDISFIDYQNKTGKVIKSLHIPSYMAEFDHIVPETLGETVLNDICFFAYVKQN